MKDTDYFITEEKKQAWEEKEQEKLTEQHDTVGAVAVDQEGNLAAATSLFSTWAAWATAPS